MIVSILEFISGITAALLILASLYGLYLLFKDPDDPRK